MSVHPLQSSDQPTPDTEAVACALKLTGTVVNESPLAAEQFQTARWEAERARQLDEQAQADQKQSGQAQARAATEKLQADSRRRVPRGVGTAVAVVLAVLDAVPAYWGAQAFGLDQTSTLVVTVLLCAALGGAMWLLDLFSSQQRRRTLRVLQGCLTGGLIALFVLRLDYLQVAVADGFWLAAIQALALTAMSGVLIVIGYVLLAYRVPKSLAVAQRAARQAAAVATAATQAAQAAHTQAGVSRAALGGTLVAWILTHPQQDVSHDRLVPALDQALDTLLGH
jgi:hypothetical protein